MVVIAGPSRSRKSTVFSGDSFAVPWFNVDHWCAQVSGSYQNISPQLRALGARQCEAFVREMIASASSFSVETTLRGTHALAQAREASAAGFLTVMNYISTETLAVAIERVRRRGLAGGHSAPPAVIAEIYEKSHQNLSHAVETFHQVNIFSSPQASVGEGGEWSLPRLEARFVDQALLSLRKPVAPWLLRTPLLNQLE